MVTWKWIYVALFITVKQVVKIGKNCFPHGKAETQKRILICETFDLKIITVVHLQWLLTENVYPYWNPKQFAVVAHVLEKQTNKKTEFGSLVLLFNTELQIMYHDLRLIYNN